jgi:hypothetical protein
LTGCRCSEPHIRRAEARRRRHEGISS